LLIEVNEMGLALKDTEHHCYGDYLHWADNNYELIDGEAYFMAPAPNLEHQEVAGDVYFQLRSALAGKKCRAFIAPIDVRLPKKDEADESIDTVVQPDVLVVCDSHKLDRRGIRGAPDWILEVLSPSTASHDQIKKRELYERHGVREYWLIHPIETPGKRVRFFKNSSLSKCCLSDFVASTSVIYNTLIAFKKVDALVT
jgi:Uma2 family endonuclease